MLYVQPAARHGSNFGWNCASLGTGNSQKVFITGAPVSRSPTPGNQHVVDKCSGYYTVYDCCSDISEECASSILRAPELGPGGCWSDELMNRTQMREVPRLHWLFRVVTLVSTRQAGLFWRQDWTDTLSWSVSKNPTYTEQLLRHAKIAELGCALRAQK
jgi:hypothetical protein